MLLGAPNTYLVDLSQQPSKIHRLKTSALNVGGLEIYAC